MPPPSGPLTAAQPRFPCAFGAVVVQSKTSNVPGILAWRLAGQLQSSHPGVLGRLKAIHKLSQSYPQALYELLKGSTKALPKLYQGSPQAARKPPQIHLE
jgi:hypothetical protein